MSSPGGVLLKTELAAPNPHPISLSFFLLIPIPGPGQLVPEVHLWTGTLKQSYKGRFECNFISMIVVPIFCKEEIFKTSSAIIKSCRDSGWTLVTSNQLFIFLAFERFTSEIRDISLSISKYTFFLLRSQHIK